MFIFTNCENGLCSFWTVWEKKLPFWWIKASRLSSFLGARWLWNVYLHVKQNRAKSKIFIECVLIYFVLIYVICKIVIEYVLIYFVFTYLIYLVLGTWDLSMISATPVAAAARGVWPAAFTESIWDPAIFDHFW